MDVSHTLRDNVIRAQLELMSASPAFARAGRMYPVLKYLVEAELSGVADRLNQRRIAIDAFGRDERFDPAVDSIVRAEIGRLRAQLLEYYATTGREDEIVIELPKGQYRPSIRGREAAADFHFRHASAVAVPRAETAGIGWKRTGYLLLVVLMSTAMSSSRSTHIVVLNRGRPDVAAAETRTLSADAAALFLKASGRDLSLDDRLDDLKSALEIDPNFAEAAAFLAFLYSQSLTSTVFGPPAGSSARAAQLARHYADMAMRIDPSGLDSRVLSEIALGSVDFFTWRWRRARQEFERAEDLAPNDVRLLYLAYLDAYAGRAEEAIALMRRLSDHNGNFPVLWSILGLVQGIAQQYDAAVESLNTGLGSDAPNKSQLIERSWLVAIKIAQGDESGARWELDILGHLLGPEDTGLLPFMAYASHRLGEQSDARDYFDRLKGLGDETFGAADWATAYLAVGDNEMALEWLRRAAERVANYESDANFFALNGLRINVTADPVLDRPEFADVLARLVGR